VRTAEAYLRSRQSSDGLWYPGTPVKGESPRSAGKAGGKPAGKDKDVADAIWLTLRVLVVLRRIN